jgi:hypothetical protein
MKWKNVATPPDGSYNAIDSTLDSVVECIIANTKEVCDAVYICK